MGNEHDYTGFAIENILHPIIETIEQEKCAQKKNETTSFYRIFRRCKKI